MLNEETFDFRQRLGIVLRCLLCSCPRCGYRPLAGVSYFKTECQSCGLVLDRKNGFLLAALPNAYFIYAFFWLLPLLLIWAQQRLSYEQAFGLLAAGAVVLPALVYNYCKMIALAQYYFFLPEELYRNPDQSQTAT